MNLFEDRGVVITVERYDELLHKEALLEAVKSLCDRMSDYAVRDAVVYLLKTNEQT